MAPKQILSEVRRTPFSPFRMVLGNGTVFDIRHADQCMVLPQTLVVGQAMPAAETEMIGWTVNVNPHNVVRIERDCA
ncbi:MAG TPA: hypothetical protein VH092_00610 [Urbifossiella sp.]|jgi:hypothetical protein|nr:hypothetical protein [Urbifossiella sp.]